MKKLILTVPLVAALATCGGNQALVVNPVVPVPLDAIGEIADRLEANYGEAIESGVYNDASALPAEGVANYEGVVLLGGSGVVTGDSDPRTVGQLNLSVDFEDGDIVGTGSNFYDLQDESESEGELTLSAQIDGTTGTFSGDVDGYFGTDQDTTYDAVIEGGFVGEGDAALFGTGNGSISIDRGEGLEELGFGVIFAAEQ